MAVSDEIPGPPATGDTSGRRRHPLGSGRRARRGRVVRLPAALGVLLALAAVAGAARLPARGEPARIAYGVDGDTVELAGGERVRLVQIDTPEVYGSPECYGEQASAVTRRLLPRGTAVRLYAEPRTAAAAATPASSSASHCARDPGISACGGAVRARRGTRPTASRPARRERRTPPRPSSTRSQKRTPSRSTTSPRRHAIGRARIGPAVSAVAGTTTCPAPRARTNRGRSVSSGDRLLREEPPSGRVVGDVVVDEEEARDEALPPFGSLAEGDNAVATEVG